MYLPAANRVVALEPETGRRSGGIRSPAARLPGAASRIGPARAAIRRASSSPRTPSDRAQRQDGRARPWLRQGRRSGHGGAVQLGAAHLQEHRRRRSEHAAGSHRRIGNARAFDARTGAKLWEFSSVPQPGEVGHDTWEGDSWKGRFGVNAWPFYFSVDTQRGLLYLPLASADRRRLWRRPEGREPVRQFGGRRGCPDRQVQVAFSNHPSRPLGRRPARASRALFDIVRNGRRIPALALTTKSGYLYILNRETGQPIFGVEERPVPKSDVPGELAFPTQPFPVKPTGLARVGYNSADLVTAADTTPEHARACAELVEKSGGVYNAGPFTPWRYRAEGDPPQTTLVFPGGLGGANWGGAAFDPNTGYVFVVTQDVGALGWIQPAAGLARTLREGHSRPRHLRRPHRRCELAVPETAMGPPDGGQCVDRRHRVADPARHHRTTSRREAEHRTTRAGGCHRDRRRRVVHRVDR